MTMLSLLKFNASLGGRSVLRDISLEVEPGEFIGLIGPNGAGKSTLLRSIMGLIPSSGTVMLGSRDSSKMSATDRALKAAYIAQSRDVAWAMPVEALVALGRTPHRDRFAPLTDVDRKAVEDAMHRMDLAAFRERPVNELSGGELARVLIARALAQETSLLLADEPTAGLDPSHQITLMRLFLELAGHNRTVVASTHDLGLAARFCTRLILLQDGGIVADGAPETVLTPQNLGSVYGVRAHFGETEGRMLLAPIDLSKDPT